MADTAVAPTNKFSSPNRKVGPLDAAKRENIPSDEFAGPDRSYPVEDRDHAGKAKGRAKEMLRRGVISDAEYRKIVAKADAEERRTGGIPNAR